MSRNVKCKGLRIDKNGWELLSMVSLSVLFLGVFAYVPMFGIILAFKDGDGVLNLTNAMFQSEWVGFDNFKEFFLDKDFIKLLFTTYIKGKIIIGRLRARIRA